jgi:hypothetical protein
MARRRHVRLLRAERNSLADFTRHGEPAGDFPRRTGSAGRADGCASAAGASRRQAVVRKGGLEPPRLAASEPKSGASTNSATSAWREFYGDLHGVGRPTARTSRGGVAAAKRKGAGTAAATTTSRSARQHATPHSRNRHEHQNRPAGCLPRACRGRLRSTRNRRPLQHPTARRCRQHRPGLHHVGQRPAARLAGSGGGAASTASGTRRGTTSRAVTHEHRCGRSPCKSQTPRSAPGGPPHLLERSQRVRRSENAAAPGHASWWSSSEPAYTGGPEVKPGARRGTMPIQRTTARSAARTKKRTPGISPGRSVLGGPSRIRTLDLLIKSQLLYQLS